MNVVKEWITPSGLKGFLSKTNFAINGYVKIPKDHPDYGKDHEDVDVYVHGGLTYNDEEGGILDSIHNTQGMYGMPKISLTNHFSSLTPLRLKSIGLLI